MKLAKKPRRTWKPVLVPVPADAVPAGRVTSTEAVT
jgi:hypothetical protein